MAHLILKSTELKDRRLPLPGRVVVIGRSLDADLPILNETISRRHALIEAVEDGFVISDLGSSNGTFVMDRQVEKGDRVPLPIGAPFRLGVVDIVLAPDEQIAPDPAPVVDRGAAASVPVAAPAPKPVAVPAPKPAAKPAPRPAAAVAERPEAGRRTRASVTKRVAQLQAKRNAMRWLGVLIGVVLLVLAGIFVGKIVDRENGAKPAVRPGVEDQEKKEPSRPVIKPLGE